jgi:glycosyltransferase involved in cell wall biosynthesis
MDHPQISVVIPFLNMRRYLAEAVDSVYDQNDADWELLLMDDGSTDGGVELARELAGRDPKRVRLLLPADGDARGASAARNRGLRAARGETIAFLDADDVWLPGKLERQRRILMEYPRAAMTFARVHYFFDDPAEGPEWDQPFEPLHEGIYSPPDLATAFLRDDNIYPCPGATLIRRATLLAVGGFEERFAKVRTDLAVWVKLGACFPVHADLAVVARYRQHGQSSVARLFADPEAKWMNDVSFNEWLLEYVADLPGRIRVPLEDEACRRLYRLFLAKLPPSGRGNALQWRWGMLRRMAPYPAFRRRWRWLRMLLPGGVG